MNEGSCFFSKSELNVFITVSRYVLHIKDKTDLGDTK
jgi:hypothetical protein